MLPLDLFARRNFSVANVETFLMYGGMAVQGFFLTLFLQQVAGFSALEAGSAGLVPTLMMFLLSRRFGAAADSYGPRWFLTFGPLLVAGGFLLMLRLDETTSYAGDLLPALLVYSLGLAVTVSPLTATVLADADEHDAGIASAVNNAIARTAGLLATAAVARSSPPRTAPRWTIRSPGRRSARRRSRGSTPRATAPSARPRRAGWRPRTPRPSRAWCSTRASTRSTARR